jgi:uncharacterized protein (DUF1697 family)
MPSYIALLRGVNVAGKNRIRMAELKAAFESLGFADVETYLQSGNVVFRADPADPRLKEKSIQGRLAEAFGVEIETLLLSGRVFDRVALSNPLKPGPGADETLSHATFLFRPVAESAFGKISLPAGPGERAVWGGPVIYLYCPHGYGRTKLNNSFFEKALRAPATTRNWRTVRALQALAAER